MRKTILLLIMIIASVSKAWATDPDDAILDRIQDVNSSLSTMQAHFTQIKTLAATGRQVDYEGTLYFSSPDKMSMPYTTPDTDVFIINGSRLYMVRDGKEGLYDTNKNTLMRNLSNTLCSCVLGQIRALAQENDAEIISEQTSDGYLVTLSAQKKSTKGYSRIVLLYDDKNLALVKMELVEFNGTTNLYEMSSIKLGVTVDDSVYNIPESKRQVTQQEQ